MIATSLPGSSNFGYSRLGGNFPRVAQSLASRCSSVSSRRFLTLLTSILSSFIVLIVLFSVICFLQSDCGERDRSCGLSVRPRRLDQVPLLSQIKLDGGDDIFRLNQVHAVGHPIHHVEAEIIRMIELESVA